MLSQLQPKMFRLEQCLHKLCQGTRKGTNRSRFAPDSQPFTVLLSQSSFTTRTKKSSRVLVGGKGGGKNRQIPKDSLQVPAQHQLLPEHRMGTPTFPLSPSVRQLNLILNINYRGLLAKIRPSARDKISKHTTHHSSYLYHLPAVPEPFTALKNAGTSHQVSAQNSALCCARKHRWNIFGNIKRLPLFKVKQFSRNASIKVEFWRWRNTTAWRQGEASASNPNPNWLTAKPECFKTFIVGTCWYNFILISILYCTCVYNVHIYMHIQSSF